MVMELANIVTLDTNWIMLNVKNYLLTVQIWYGTNPTILLTFSK
jgi:hypothetical protein